MSEQIIVANRHLVCDLCGRRIPKGSRCRMVRDDFMPHLTFLEHLRCPSAPTAVVGERKTLLPVISSCQPMPVLA